MFHFWFHTNFIQGNKLLLTKSQLDCKTIKGDKKYREDFAIEMTFEKVEHRTNRIATESVDGSTNSIERNRSISKFAFRRQPSRPSLEHIVAVLESEKLEDTTCEASCKAEEDGKEVKIQEIVLDANELQRDIL